MLYKTDIANLALGMLGISSTIADIETDNSVEARVIKRNFRTSLDYYLEQHEWNFARGTAPLLLQFSDPEPAYEFSYYIPADALVIRQIAFRGEFILDQELYPDQKIPFREVYIGTTKLLYTNTDEAHAEYTVQMPENGVFPNHFGRGLAAQLSMDVAPSLITNNYPKVKKELNENAMNGVAAGIADDLARQPQHKNAKSTFIRARY